MSDPFEFFSGGFDDIVNSQAEKDRDKGALQYPEKVNRLPGIAKFFVVDKDGNGEGGDNHRVVEHNIRLLRLI